MEKRSKELLGENKSHRFSLNRKSPNELIPLHSNVTPGKGGTPTKTGEDPTRKEALKSTPSETQEEMKANPDIAKTKV